MPVERPLISGEIRELVKRFATEDALEASANRRGAAKVWEPQLRDHWKEILKGAQIPPGPV